MKRARDLAVVTGAGSGIGRATAIALAVRGLDVAILGRTLPDLEACADAMRGRAPEAGAHVIRCDVSRPDDVTRSARAILDGIGVPRVVVNNAGVVVRAPIEATTDDLWAGVLDTNLTGPFMVTRAFLPDMRARSRGRFVQIASISATLGTPGLAAYCASKWGLVGFTKVLAEELRGTGLQALAILPGSVDTEMLVGSGFAPQMTPEQVAGVVVYASLDAPDAMNGSCIDLFGP